MREKLIDDLAGIVGSLIGLANDARTQLKSGVRHATKECAVRSGLSTQEEIEALKLQVAALETRLGEANAKGKKK